MSGTNKPSRLSPESREQALAFEIEEKARMLHQFALLPGKETFWKAAGELAQLIQVTKELEDAKKELDNATHGMPR